MKPNPYRLGFLLPGGTVLAGVWEDGSRARARPKLVLMPVSGW